MIETSAAGTSVSSDAGQPPAPAPPLPRLPVVVGATALVFLVGVVFHPVVGFELVEFDAADQVVDNPYIRGLTGENLIHILTSRCVTSYYPVRTLTYAIDYQVWGLEPVTFKLSAEWELRVNGFKLTNLLIHLANVLLVAWLLLRLFRRSAAVDHTSPGWPDAATATLAAGMFAVHPVVVEPVSWVPGREELLMALGALGCIHWHLTARRRESEGAASFSVATCYALTALCCAGACLSNAAGAIIPLLITVWDVLSPSRPGFRRILAATAALWVIAAATVVVKRTGYPVDTSDLPPVFSYQWLTLIASLFWLNLQTLAWPANLTILYNWPSPQAFGDLEATLGLVALSLTCLILWLLRRRKLVLFGGLWFVIALAPTSQIVAHHIARADRFLYLPLVGLAVAVAAGLRPAVRFLKEPAAVVGVTTLGIVVVLLSAVASTRQVQRWRNGVSVWEHCVAVSPNNVLAYRSLADRLAETGRFEEAFAYYERALETEPDNVEALNNYALRLASCNDERLRRYGLAVALAEEAFRLTGSTDSDVRRTLALARTWLAIDHQSRGLYARAIENYRQAIDADPEYRIPMLNLASLLAACPDPSLRDPEEAARWEARAREPSDAP
ncbi:MAG: tetratricopeptide repeat protein [Planctomycetota bacterium]|jgi:hypothetical protein